MPELPDITVYVERLADKLKGATLEVLRLCNPFFLRTVTPPWQSVQGCRVQGVSRLRWPPSAFGTFPRCAGEGKIWRRVG